MKDAASRIATIAWESHDNMIDTQWQKGVRRMIRSAIRRAVKAERERCVGIVRKRFDNKWTARTLDLAGIESEIQAKAKRPSRKRATMKKQQKKASVYGYCPICGTEGLTRERRIGGNDMCGQGHTYPSSTAKKKRPSRKRK